MTRKKFELDKQELVYRQVRLSFKQKIARFSVFIVLTVGLTVIYGLTYKSIFGSPKEKFLEAELAELQYKYKLLNNDFDMIDQGLDEIARIENSMIRPVLDMDTLAQSLRSPGFGGSKRYGELEGYDNSDIMVEAFRKLDELERKAYVQSRSYEEIIPVAGEWKSKLMHIPYIRPVKVDIALGEGIKFRNDHPVLHVSRWHYGQDFRAPSGTEVFATGSGTVVKAAWTPYGFGNRIEIDHGYGFHTIYAHLSEFLIEPGQKVSRGDLIGLSGSTGVSSGPHLHYEIHYNGKVQNPLYFFNDDLSLSEYNKMIEVLEKESTL